MSLPGGSAAEEEAHDAPKETEKPKEKITKKRKLKTQATDKAKKKKTVQVKQAEC